MKPQLNHPQKWLALTDRFKPVLSIQIWKSDLILDSGNIRLSDFGFKNLITSNFPKNNPNKNHEASIMSTKTSVFPNSCIFFHDVYHLFLGFHHFCPRVFPQFLSPAPLVPRRSTAAGPLWVPWLGAWPRVPWKIFVGRKSHGEFHGR